jgi:hypothetical protein
MYLLSIPLFIIAVLVLSKPFFSNVLAKNFGRRNILKRLYHLAVFQDYLCHAKKKVSKHYFDFILYANKYIYFINILYLPHGGLSGYSDNPKLVYYHKNKKTLIDNPLIDAFSLKDFSTNYELDQKQLIRLLVISGKVLINDFTLRDQLNVVGEKDIINYIKQNESDDNNFFISKKRLLEIYQGVK